MYGDFSILNFPGVDGMLSRCDIYEEVIRKIQNLGFFFSLVFSGLGFGEMGINYLGITLLWWR